MLETIGTLPVNISILLTYQLNLFCIPIAVYYDQHGLCDNRFVYFGDEPLYTGTEQEHV